ncbi:prepilin-type N-terminal cleavage/methylation domain-containing protein [Coraliomargarita algicola]|uniref:Prepilin-type N-terminal cleavage/methylation domain-containing protein n=1 Tax=Coraliomargarita algicola TaxID=3092156 RepID=A0ABZ0RNV5_9BACT|nr:prepilin-type N-terminal cleavage/methylation domain-containing protein [Coraliomargarita sp. J2-16]WPJ97096.1 prepilin-type N-terminal cleavage/methylation domain-containing protein [Coraliomargarita sp. J2-16]
MPPANPHQSKHKRHPRQGFTLTELLLVIAIIAILFSILLPTVGKMKTSANKAKCASNLRNLALACRSYSVEHNARAPHPNLTNDLEPSYIHAPHYYEVAAYEDTLAPYLGDRFDTMYCPGELSNDPIGSYDPEIQRQANTPNEFVSYQYFQSTSTGAPSGNAKAEYSLLFSNTLNAPIDCAMWGCLTYITGSKSFGHMEGRSSSGSIEGMNAAYADGSVRWVPFDQLEPYTADGSYLWPKPLHEQP